MQTSATGTWNEPVNGGRCTADSDRRALRRRSSAVLCRPPILDTHLRKVFTIRHPPSAVRSTGFTLMEVLVVIVIIGVIVSAATIAFGVLGGDREAEDETRRFWALLQQAREEAELQSLDLGVHIAESSYEFLRFDPRRNLWLPIEGDVLYLPRELPAGLRFRVWVEQREVVLKPDLPVRTSEDEDEEDEDGEDLGDNLRNPVVDAKSLETSTKFPPHVMVMSSGEILPFEVQIERDGAEAMWRVVGQPDNDLRVERRRDDRDWALVAQTNVPDEEEEEEKPRGRT